jgi:hypothetical protein
MNAGPASPACCPGAGACVALPNTTPAMPSELQPDPRPRRAARPLHAEQPAHDADERGPRGHHERGGARRAARDPLDEAHLVEAVPEHAEHGEPHRIAARRPAVAARERDGAEHGAGEQHPQAVEGERLEVARAHLEHAEVDPPDEGHQEQEGVGQPDARPLGGAGRRARRAGRRRGARGGLRAAGRDAPHGTSHAAN